MDIDYEKLKYLLNNQAFNIDRLIENVIGDSDADPHYSAVTATNLVKCYIEIMNEIGEELPCSNVEEYVTSIGFSHDDYLMFEEKRKKESIYYHGVQY